MKIEAAGLEQPAAGHAENQARAEWTGCGRSQEQGHSEAEVSES